MKIYPAIKVKNMQRMQILSNNSTCDNQSILSTFWVVDHWSSICIGLYFIWAATQENLSSRFPTKIDSNHPAQLQKLARILKFRL